MICIVDYGMGNLQSVSNAIEALGFKSKVIRHPEELNESSSIILPGVGAFADGMRNLRERGFVEALEEHVLRGKKPYLGICLGMQFLAKESLELGKHAGLGWLNCRVRKINADVKIPHMGWNEIKISSKTGLYREFDDTPVCYFVHSYFLDAKEFVTGTTFHGETIVASVQKDNIFGVQFHPEKSQGHGLKILKNFLETKW